MCGLVCCPISAIDANPDQACVASATQRLAHRGPDDDGFFSDHDVPFDYKRLATTDSDGSTGGAPLLVRL
jgi:asparagine synthase (glutamine-hydrolysing)